MKYQIIDLRDYPDLLKESIEYVAERWGLNRRIFEDCIISSMTTKNPLPRWYFMMKQDEIIGSYSLMNNDFVSRQDLWPYLSNLYIEQEQRGKGLGSVLMTHARQEAYKLGFSKLYLCTDHIDYYEKYGWVHLCNGYHTWNRESQIYVIDTHKEEK
ncbi:GNAT family N-acetyltransferase [Paenibacillus tundrae]|uniref:GNAT superfamily N-acetyltransferase n=1 Tax=Paenibacillus tundrae TaxID=528187 RepID=A0ABT9WBR1_9BACL|nr:GNAT family N-acetyltransferase [Paenibacillus tundrae]MDQ0170555.1 GNAT superfamily N-acetyltransferase [Paenibacillus tundrae]